MALAESVLSEIKTPIQGESPLVFSAIERLGWYYRDTKQYEKGATTWLRLLDLLPQQGWWTADAQIQAAMLYASDGRDQNALKLYIDAGHNSDGSLAAGAIFRGLSSELRRDPKAAEVRLLQLEKEVKVPDARLATQFLLAWARYKTGDWNAFLLQSQQVLAQYENIDEQSRRRTFAPLALHLENGQKWAKLWRTNVIVAEQPALDLKFDGPLQQPVERRIFVDTPTPAQLQVTVIGDTQRISARIEESPWAPDLEDVRHQQIVMVTIAPGAAQVEALIRVFEPNQPKGEFQIPVKIASPQ